MPRLAGLALLAISSCAPGIAVAQSAPLSPFELAQSIDSGSPIDWNATWKKLGRTDEPPPSLVHCGDPQFWSCSTELITVPSPSQIIMLVQPEYGGDDSCLRFMKQGDGWKFTGYHEAYLKYYPRRHEMLRFAGKPFLEISVQGASGSGLASETAEWFDLTLPGFEPAFSFPVQGHNNLLPSAIGWQVQGDAMQERDSAVEAIHLFLTVRFDFDGEDLSGANFSGIYERSPGEAKFALKRANMRHESPAPVSISTKDFEDMTDVTKGPSPEQMLVYALPGLSKIAVSGAAETRSDLQALLEYYRNTPEKRELERLLRGGR